MIAVVPAEQADAARAVDGFVGRGGTRRNRRADRVSVR